MSKKVTIRDVAREAGVSVATVSYIMNGRTDMKISEETKKKVLQIANLLNYVPSTTAQSLSTGRHNMVGLSYRLSDNAPSRNLEIAAFVNLLIEQLNRMHYDVIYLPINADDTSFTIKQNIDGIIAIDLSAEEFSAFANSYLVPIIAVDMIIDDTLFYQVYSDIPTALDLYFSEHKDAFLVMEEYRNKAFSSFITSGIDSSQVKLIENADSKELTSLKGQPILVLGTYLALMLRPYVCEEDMTVISSNQYSHMLPSTIRVLDNNINKKASLAINLLLNAIDRNFVVNHKYSVEIDTAAVK